MLPDDSEEEDPEEGEEEDIRENDPCVEPAKSEISASVVARPALALGSLDICEPVPKKVQKRKREEESDAVDLDNPPEGDVDQAILAVPKLKIMVEELGCAPPCFLGLVPSLILEGGQSVGKQLRGVGCYEACACLLCVVAVTSLIVCSYCSY